MRPAKKNLLSTIIPIHGRRWDFLETGWPVIRKQIDDIVVIIVLDRVDRELQQDLLGVFQHKMESVCLVCSLSPGAGAARNVGINVADTPFIHFCDSDDSLTSGFYERVLAVLEKSRHDMYHLDYLVENKGHKETARTSAPEVVTLEGQIFQRTLSCLTTIVRKSDIRFRENLLFHEDYFYWCENLARFSACHKITGFGGVYKKNPKKRYRQFALYAIYFFYGVLTQRSLSRTQKLNAVLGYFLRL